MIRGQRIVLTGIDSANAEVVRGWLNDPAVHEWMLTGHVPITAAAEREWYERAERESAAGTAYNFEIRAADDLRLLGILPTMVNRKLSVNLSYEADLRQIFGAEVFEAVMPLSTDYKEAVMVRKPVNLVKPRSAASPVRSKTPSQPMAAMSTAF